MIYGDRRGYKRASTTYGVTHLEEGNGSVIEGHEASHEGHLQRTYWDYYTSVND